MKAFISPLSQPFTGRYVRRSNLHIVAAPSLQKNKRPDALVATDPNQVWSWDITYRAPRPDIGRGRILGMHRERRFLFFW